jgi:hypothetical protein
MAIAERDKVSVPASAARPLEEPISTNPFPIVELRSSVVSQGETYGGNGLDRQGYESDV